MVRLGGRREIIRTIISLLVIVHMHLRKPFVIFLQPLLRLYLRLPGPVPVKIEIIMVAPPMRPGLLVLTGLRVGIGLQSDNTVVPVDIPVPSVGVDTGIDDDDGILQPHRRTAGRSCTPGIPILPDQRIQCLHRCLRTGRLIPMHVVAQPHDHRTALIRRYAVMQDARQP